MDFRETLNLPDPDFTIPMKADLANLEVRIQEIWDQQGLYHRIQAARAGAPSYVLHDGPPYTNSPVHTGTAMNKILKDFVVKSRTMMGFRCPYVPGYDNHGLPIEQAVQKKFAEKQIRPTQDELRKACREHAASYVDIQTKQFKRLGVLGLWERPYTTMDFRFEAEIVRVFKTLVEKGYVYKGLRPTLWSPTSRTALADTEIVYQDHVSKAIYVRFPLRHDENGFSKGLPNFYTIIWTTTPWTIPANLAVAFNPEENYSVVEVGKDHYLVAEKLVEKVAGDLGWDGWKVLFTDLGVSFEKSIFKHPIFDRDSIAVMADYVTMDDGTGVVHTAPGHGRDDFYTGQRYGLPILTPVDEKGILTEEAGEFVGVSYKDCDTVVVDRLREVGNLLDVRDYRHSYPHAERDGKPVIFRATEQWFVGIDTHDLREAMLAEIPKVEWVPANGQNRIEAMVRNRPDWCISRQRPWGVGVPIFYGAKSRVPVLDPLAIECVAMLIERGGSDAWFSTDPGEILPPNYEHPDTGETEFVKETDVLDVWFDSGSTCLAVVEGRAEPLWSEKYPADLYLEGSDQHRGWFNSSLLIGTAVHGRPPYKTVVTHGFITDESGAKLSKRLGNSLEPSEVCAKFGADVLRYWCASVDFVNDAPISDNLLKIAGESYRTIRNTLRFLLGNLEGFVPGQGELTVDLDRWVVDQADLLAADVVAHYEAFDFNLATRAIHDFCAKELSRFYLDAIKDRMYCDAKESAARRSGQTACHRVLIRLVRLIAPILCHTAEEVWMRLGDLGLVDHSAESPCHSVHAQHFDPPGEDRLAEIEGSPLQARFGTILGVRSNVFAAFETWKGTDGVKDSQDAVAKIVEDPETVATLKSFDPNDLANLLKLSWVEVSEGPADAVEFAKSEYLKCERSRIRRPDVEIVDGVALSRRDREVLGKA